MYFENLSRKCNFFCCLDNGAVWSCVASHHWSGTGAGEAPNKFHTFFLSARNGFFSDRPGTGVRSNMASLSAWFWNERFWLPHNVTWADLADPAPGVEYPKVGHLFSALPLALGIFAVRLIFERFVSAAQIGRFLFQVKEYCVNLLLTDAFVFARAEWWVH